MELGVGQVRLQVVLGRGSEVPAVPPGIVEPAAAVGAHGSEVVARDDFNRSTAERLVGVLVQVDLYALGAGPLDGHDVDGRLTPRGRALRLDMGPDHANPGLTPDPDGLRHAVSGREPPAPGPGRRWCVVLHHARHEPQR